MTAMAMAESFDAQMMDFSGEDIPMQTSSSASWVHPEATMDDDSNFHLDGVEIDMENYHPETFEYEMADDSSAEQPIEVHDVEVIDVSQAHTPTLIDTVVEDAIAVPEHDLTDAHDRSPLNTPPAVAVQVPSPTSQPAQDEEHPEVAAAEPLGQSEWEQGRSELPGIPPSPNLTEHHQPQNSAEPESLEGATEPTPTWDDNAPVEQQAYLRQPTPTPVERLQPESTHEESADDPPYRWGDEGNPVPSRASSGDPHEVSDGIFIDPPPPVLLSLGDSEEEYYLFNRPTRKSPAANEATTDDSLFLHDLPTLYYEPLGKVFEALRSDNRLTPLFDLPRGELVIDAYDLVDLVISEVSCPLTVNGSYKLTHQQDSLYTNEVSFHDLNLLHDHTDLAGPLRVRIGCSYPRFITRYRELKSKLEQFNLLDEVSVDDAQLREQGEQTLFLPLLSPHYSAKPTDDLVERPDINDVPEYSTQDEQGDEPLAPEGFGQVTTDQRTDDGGSDAHAVDRSDEGEPLNEPELEQAQPASYEESTAGPLAGDEHTEQPVGVAEGDHEQGTTAVTISDNDYPGSAEDLDAAAVHEHSDVRNTSPPGGNATEDEEAVATNEDYEADYNENDPHSELGETVTIQGDTRDGDWERTASDAQQTQDHLEQHEIQHDATGVDKCEQVVHHYYR
jgi:hypothetical protein